VSYVSQKRSFGQPLNNLEKDLETAKTMDDLPGKNGVISQKRSFGNP